ncbi:ribosomal protein L23/L15e core domain-containing protein [Baffinella frigidus]|nr:ribosomal protein L23/L15e core domain-containing protein [Cryptophyta sp. CCMP2293]|mmetsp:Transcript_43662/g.103766  ORF Transcript_43662/g.103766 Transcript_43662/m.103766 type:complete len:132 (-) Transcript_43662:2107-2502(-)
MKNCNFLIQTKKIKNNPLLKRKQFIVEISHQGKPNIPANEIKKKLAEIYKIKDQSVIFLFGFRTEFGGNKSTGFGFIYYDINSARKIESGFRLRRNLLVKTEKISGKQRKERKNRGKKLRGKEKSKIFNSK